MSRSGPRPPATRRCWAGHICSSAGTARSPVLMTMAAPTCSRPWTISSGPVTCPAWARLFASLTCVWTGDWAGAATHSGQALALFREADDRHGQGLALAGLGECHAHLGNYSQARGHARQALEL